MSDPAPAAFLDVHVPTYWDGLLLPVTVSSELLFVLGAMLAPLGQSSEPVDERAECVRTRLAFDGPRPDRVWITAEQDGRERSFAGFARELAQLGKERHPRLSLWIEDLRSELEESFAAGADEVVRRCMPPYHGFLHAWTDEHTARAHYRTWPRRRQAEFLHEYLLYAESDRRASGQLGIAIDTELQDAAAWVLSQRRYLLRWKVMLRRQPVAAPPRADLAQRLLQCSQALRDALGTSPPEGPWREWLDEAVRPISPGVRQGPFAEVLARAGLESALIAPVLTWARLAQLVEWEPPHPGLRQPLEALRESWQQAARWMW